MDILLKYTKKLIKKTKEYMEEARRSMIISMNDELLVAYWRIGKKINEYEKDERYLIFYEDDLFDNLSNILEVELGKRFTASNLKYMKKFNLKFNKKEIRKSKLSWSHYKELLSIENDNERKFYYDKATKLKWSVRELQRQIESRLYYKSLPKTLNLTH